MAAGARRRLLPAWMGAAGDERAAAAPKAGRRQAKAGPRSAAVVYCMNEAELVDVALAVLAEVSPDPRAWGRGPGRTSAAGRAPGRGQGALPPSGSLAAPLREAGLEALPSAARVSRSPPPLPGGRRGRRSCLCPPAAPAGAADKTSLHRGPGDWRGVSRGDGGLPPYPLRCSRGEVAHRRVWLCSFWSHLQCEEGEEKARSRSEEEQELQATPNAAPGSTASTGGSGDRSPALPSPPDAGAGADAERTGWEDSEDDVLKYVREIFFS
ncbi:cell cycle regulator of non-homologous end joining isoform X1 [Ciconia boyciana]|uniref:cell cycle regulator of non-homologous end joining isoform X1 n=1 Tax=Ciconia boyciana TaxID=52775 RepID=UPI003BA0C20C